VISVTGPADRRLAHTMLPIAKCSGELGSFDHMCGFAFLLNRSLPPHVARDRVKSALSLLNNRGPDESTQTYHDGISMGHARLSIVDVANSSQPMSSADGRYHLLFNGEIYNYRELRERLRDQWQFRTGGDTEVLLAGLVQSGPRFLSALEGMWSLLLWDSQRREVLVSRDRTGKKPLYYDARNQEFYCASELPALRRISPDDWEEDEDSVADYFRYGFPLPGFTFYKGVYELRAGCYAIWNRGVELVDKPYWRPAVRRFVGRHEDAVVQLRECLQQSVAKRLQADVEVGCFLSGGVDSSIITALSAQCSAAETLKTFTVGFTETSFDERRFAAIVASRYKTDHSESVVDDSCASLLHEIMHARIGQPFSDPSIVPTAMLSKLASSRLKVVLTGDGSDELFGGYDRYRAQWILGLYGSIPLKMRESIRKLVEKIPDSNTHHSRSIFQKLRVFLEVSKAQQEHVPYIAYPYFTRHVYSVLFPEMVGRGHKRESMLIEDAGMHEIKEMMLADTLVFLPQSIHSKVDRATMHYSLEARAPFMDTSVVELALSLPLDWSFSYMRGKRILRESFGPLLPREIWHRRKQGLSAPLAKWFRGKLGLELQHLISQQNDSRINYKAYQELMDEHRSRKVDRSRQLWLLYVYLLWHSKS
jgi:asparagine synthase (glutamine-hydrolysing)